MHAGVTDRYALTSECNDTQPDDYWHWQNVNDRLPSVWRYLPVHRIGPGVPVSPDACGPSTGHPPDDGGLDIPRTTGAPREVAMTASPTTTKAAETGDGKTRAVVPVPRQSPEDRHDPEEQPQPYYAYPGVGYALEHATALRPRGR
jgi:hypothetical protein